MRAALQAAPDELVRPPDARGVRLHALVPVNPSLLDDRCDCGTVHNVVDVKIVANVRLNAYEVIARAVEEGVAYGYKRAHKHTDTPDEIQMRDALEHAIMGA